MCKFLTFLVVSVMCCSVVFAQVNKKVITPKDMLAASEAHWKEYDTTTEWGKWLVNEVKPYWDKTLEASLSNLLPKIDANMSVDEQIKETNRGEVKYYEAMQKIAPPDEFKIYHANVLKALDIIIQYSPSSGQDLNHVSAMSQKFQDEAKRELVRIFNKHGVPQNIIAKFTKTP